MVFGVTAEIADFGRIIESCSCNNKCRPNANSDFDFLERLASVEIQIPIACLDLSTYRRAMGQQHRARAKRKRRRAYLQRKKASLRATRRERAKPRTMKQRLTVE